MLTTLLIRSARFVVPLIIAALLLSCSASQHAGRTLVQKPPLSETNADTWYAYWHDQFDAYEGHVLAPTAEYPDASRQAYQRASDEWTHNVRESSSKSWLLWTGIGLVASVALYYFAFHASSNP